MCQMQEMPTSGRLHFRPWGPLPRSAPEAVALSAMGEVKARLRLLWGRKTVCAVPEWHDPYEHFVTLGASLGAKKAGLHMLGSKE